MITQRTLTCIPKHHVPRRLVREQYTGDSAFRSNGRYPAAARRIVGMAPATPSSRCLTTSPLFPRPTTATCKDSYTWRVCSSCNLGFMIRRAGFSGRLRRAVASHRRTVALLPLLRRRGLPRVCDVGVCDDTGSGLWKANEPQTHPGNEVHRQPAMCGGENGTSTC